MCRKDVLIVSCDLADDFELLSKGERRKDVLLACGAVLILSADYVSFLISDHRKQVPLLLSDACEKLTLCLISFSFPLLVSRPLVGRLEGRIARRSLPRGHWAPRHLLASLLLFPLCAACCVLCVKEEKTMNDLDSCDQRV